MESTAGIGIDMNALKWNKTMKTDKKCQDLFDCNENDNNSNERNIKNEDRSFKVKLKAENSGDDNNEVFVDKRLLS